MVTNAGHSYTAYRIEAILVKFDVRNGYRLVLIHPDDR